MNTSSTTSLDLRLRGRSSEAFSLPEVLVAIAITGLSLSGIIYGYVSSSTRAEWSAYSLAAHSLAMQRLEQTRACKWDLQAWPVVDELVLTNFPTQINILDIPISGSNVVYATNFTVIRDVSTNTPLKLIRVDCVWRFMSRGLFTNSIASYRAPDQ